MKTHFKMAAALGAALLMGMVQAHAQATAPKPQPPVSAAPGGGPGPGPGPGGCPGWGGGYGHGMGPGMMGGYGPGAGGGMGPGYGMGPGMGGYGMGPGFGGGPGMGYGRGYGGLAGLNLTDDQRKAINKIMDDQQKAQYDAYGKIMQQNSKLRDLYSQDKWDANAITGAYDQIQKQRLAMLRSRIDARNKIYDVLTPQQRQQFRQFDGDGDVP